MKWISTLLVFCVLASGCAGPYVLDDDNAAVVTPLEIGDEGHIIIETRINGLGPFRFALDTGASISVIFDTTRETAGISLTDDRPVKIHGMLSSGTFPTTILEELKIGAESWTNVRVASLPAGTIVSDDIDGLLGNDFLRRYALGVSVKDRVVRLYSPSLVSERSYRGWTSIPLQELEVGSAGATAYTITMQINDIEIPAMLDLGAGSNLMNWRTAKAIGVRPIKPEDETEIAGVVESEPVAAELDVHLLQIESVFWRHRIFLVSEYPIFEVLGLEDRVVAIIGPGLFNERDFVLDFERKRMLLGGRK